MKLFRQYTEFFWTFTWRNIRLQYNSFWLGLFWGIIQPLLMSAIFFVALKNSVGVNFSHYFIYIYSGFIFWSVFSGSLSQAYVCFLHNDSMVKQIYFPRFLLPITFLASRLMDLLIALIILVVMLWVSDLEVHIGWFIFYTLLSVVQLLLVATGFNLLFSVICVRFRGFQVIFPFMSQAIFFTASVIYDVRLSVDIEWLKPIFEYNPISTVLATFRSGIFHHQVSVTQQVFSMVYALIICLLGYVLFKWENKNLTDRL
jgi:ABC-type polysaccharide/polyol phosphate export permease